MSYRLVENKLYIGSKICAAAKTRVRDDATLISVFRVAQEVRQ